MSFPKCPKHPKRSMNWASYNGKEEWVCSRCEGLVMEGRKDR